MRVRGIIGILRPDDGWRLLFGQIGLRAERVPSGGPIEPAMFSAIVVDQKLTDDQARRLEEYVRGGGAVLDTGGLHEKLAGKRLRTRYLRTFVPRGHPDIFGNAWLADVYGPARIPIDGGIEEPLRLSTLGNGRLALVGLDVGRLMLDSRRTRKRFYTPEGHAPDEIVARAAKGELRHLVSRAIEWLHHDRGLPLLHRWYFPGERENLFAYRIDSDYGTPAHIRAMHETARSHGVPLTWFLHVGAHHEWLDEFARYAGDEIAIHGFRHRTFRTFEENRANIAEAKALLERHGFHPQGFAAPNGFSYDSLTSAMHDLGLLYGSEFSLDYDNLPSFVPSRSGLISSLQIPVHPISIGSLIRAKMSPSAMKHYFRLMIERKLALEEPVIFYHHPLHAHLEVMADTLSAATEAGIAGVTMGELARWWHRRAAARHEITLSNEGWCRVEGAFDNDLSLRVLAPDGTLAFIGSAGTFTMDRLAWRQRRAPLLAPPDIASVRRPSVRVWRHTLEDLNARSRQ